LGVKLHINSETAKCFPPYFSKATEINLFLSYGGRDEYFCHFLLAVPRILCTFVANFAKHLKQFIQTVNSKPLNTKQI